MRGGLCDGSLKLTTQTPLIISFFSFKIVSGSEAREEQALSIEIS